MRAKRFGLVWLRRKKGFSIIEVITAVAILGIGIWAIVALFPTGQNIIRRSGLRQMATQLAHEAISDFFADPAKMPFAIVPFNPSNLPPILRDSFGRPIEPEFDPQNPPAFLLEPAYLLYVRRAYYFVWGEPLDDGLPLGDPNKRVGLVGVDTNNDGQPDQWRAILRFAPALPLPNWDTNRDGQPEIRVYREVRYERWSTIPRFNDPDFLFYFDSSQNQTLYVSPSNRRKFLRVTYTVGGEIVSEVYRELYIVQSGSGQVQLNRPAQQVISVVEEYTLVLGVDYFANGSVLIFPTPTPGPSLTQDRIGPLCTDYLIEDLDGDGYIAEDPIDGQDNDGDGRIDEDAGGHWIVETGTTFAPDPSLRQKLNIPLQATVGIFQTTFGGISVDPNTNRPIITAITLSPNRFGLPLFPAPVAPNPSPNGNSLPQEGLLVLGFDPPNTLPVPPNERVRVAYRAGDDPGTPIDESWFLQVIKPPDDFQLAPNNADPDDLQAPSPLPFEQLRWFIAQLIPDDPTTPDVDPYFRLQFLPFGALLAGLNVQVRYQVRYFNPNLSQARNEAYSEVKGIDSNGAVTIPIPLPPQGWTVDLNNTKIEEVRGASLLVRVSGGSMWRQSPPKTRADYVELATIVPPPAKLTQP
jgi:prepilin-type N-terminal cleavage/methylation domain-containing protein